jgi:hypothetical protein
MKTTKQILYYLLKHSKPEYHEFPLSDEENDLNISKKKKIEDLFLRLSGTTRYICEEKKLEKYLGEPVSFEKHLRPLYENKILYFDEVPDKGDFYDSKEYRTAFDKTTGRIRDYKNNIAYIAFHLKENNFLKHYKQILKDAKRLKII